jgi:hypothetical protein
MLASWGPNDWAKDADGNYLVVDGHKVPGEYIWFPIYYDVDTQLGVNNSGIPSWEYNVEPSTGFNNHGIPAFSTSDSLLWLNFHQSYVENSDAAELFYKQLRSGKL